MSDKFIRTTAINKIRSIKKRKKVIQGGTSAGKTFGIIPILIDTAAKTPNLEISIVSESIPHIRRGAMKDFIKIMRLTGRFIEGRWNRSLLTYSFSNGSYIEFFSADQEGKLRGARRNILYINEANNVDFDSYYQLAIRTSSDIYLDFNPTTEFWAHKEVLKENDSELVILNYKDNEALPDTIRLDIEAAKEKAKTSSYWENWWKVYGLGQVGSLQGVIFDNWEKIKEVPKEAKYLGTGLDFGFTNDPTAALDIYQFNGGLILDELIYSTGLHNNEIADQLKGKNVYADAAEPKSISEIRRHGVRIKGAKKGKDSITYGIDILQQQKLRVTERSTNVIKELRAYTWEKDRDGGYQNKPIDAYNHSIDALRYFAVSKLGKRTKIIVS